MGKLVFVLHEISDALCGDCTKEECDMLIAGCEMVMSEHREKEWREVIAAIRECYDGTVSYNTDKYQEDRVNGGIV